jgi:hypothetical protein
MNLLVSGSCTHDSRTFFDPWVTFYPKTVGDEEKKNIFRSWGSKHEKHLVHNGTKKVWALKARKIFWSIITL